MKLITKEYLVKINSSVSMLIKDQMSKLKSLDGITGVSPETDFRNKWHKNLIFDINYSSILFFHYAYLHHYTFTIIKE